MALMLIDVINALDFEGSAGIVRAAERAAPRIERITRRARAANVPVFTRTTTSESGVPFSIHRPSLFGAPSNRALA